MTITFRFSIRRKVSRVNAAVPSVEESSVGNRKESVLWYDQACQFILEEIRVLITTFVFIGTRC